MADFSAFSRPGKGVDQAIQLALREIEARPLAIAMLGMSAPDREIIYRNMSIRAVAALKEEIAQFEQHDRQRPGTFASVSASGQEAFLRKMKKYLRLVQENDALTPPSAPRLASATEAELVRSLVALKRYASRNGPEGAAQVLDQDLHPLLRKGIELYVDDWDAAVVQSILEQMREAMVTRYRNLLTIMVEGVGALFGHDLPQVVEEKLASFRLSDERDEPSRGG